MKSGPSGNFEQQQGGDVWLADVLQQGRNVLRRNGEEAKVESGRVKVDCNWRLDVRFARYSRATTHASLRLGLLPARTTTQCSHGTLRSVTHCNPL